MEKIIDSNFYWDLIISLEERMAEIDKAAETDAVLHEEFALIVHLLGCIYDYLLKGRFDASEQELPKNF